MNSPGDPTQVETWERHYEGVAVANPDHMNMLRGEEERLYRLETKQRAYLAEQESRGRNASRDKLDITEAKLSAVHRILHPVLLLDPEGLPILPDTMEPRYCRYPSCRRMLYEEDFRWNTCSFCLSKERDIANSVTERKDTP